MEVEQTPTASPPSTGGGADGRETGSSLVLMPAAVLVFVILGAFAVDFAAIQLGQREMVADAQAAANDAAAAGYDAATFYEQGEIVFDPTAAQRAAELSLSANTDEYRLRSIQVDEEAIVVVVEGEVPTIFAKAIPGAPDQVDLSARASSDLAQ